MRVEKSSLMRYVKMVSGVLLIVSGLIGLVLPIIPGWLLLLPGIALLSSVSPWFSRKIKPFFQKYGRKFERSKNGIF